MTAPISWQLDSGWMIAKGIRLHIEVGGQRMFVGGSFTVYAPSRMGDLTHLVTTNRGLNRRMRCLPAHHLPAGSQPQSDGVDAYNTAMRDHAAESVSSPSTGNEPLPLPMPRLWRLARSLPSETTRGVTLDAKQRIRECVRVVEVARTRRVELQGTSYHYTSSKWQCGRVWAMPMTK